MIPALLCAVCTAGGCGPVAVPVVSAVCASAIASGIAGPMVRIALRPAVEWVAAAGAVPAWVALVCVVLDLVVPA